MQDGGEGVQVVPPDLLQSYIQQLILAAAGGGAGGGEREDVDAATANAMQVTKNKCNRNNALVATTYQFSACAVCSNCNFFSS